MPWAKFAQPRFVRAGAAVAVAAAARTRSRYAARRSALRCVMRAVTSATTGCVGTGVSSERGERGLCVHDRRLVASAQALAANACGKRLHMGLMLRLMATMADVARAAGVSTTTVSHVLNGTRPVSDEAVARVRAAIEQTGYSHNALARGLARGGRTQS